MYLESDMTMLIHSYTDAQTERFLMHAAVKYQISWEMYAAK